MVERLLHERIVFAPRHEDWDLVRTAGHSRDIPPSLLNPLALDQLAPCSLPAVRAEHQQSQSEEETVLPEVAVDPSPHHERGIVLLQPVESTS